MKKIGVARGTLPLVNEKQVVALLLANGQRALLRWVVLAAQGESEVVAKSKELIFHSHFLLQYMRNFKQTMRYLSHNMLVMRIRCNKIPPKA